MGEIRINITKECIPAAPFRAPTMPSLAVVGVAGGLVGVATMLAAPKFADLTAIDSDMALLAVIGGLFLLLIASMQMKSSAPKLPANAIPVTLTGDEQKDFMIVFEGLTKEVLADAEPYKLPPRTADYMKRMMDYNVPKGKLTRGLTVISAYKSIKGVKKLSDVEFRRAATLGWTVEWLQAMFLVMDDIMDASETRRGQECWYKLPDVQLNAINDGLLLEAHIYVILKKYFGDEPTLYAHRPQTRQHALPSGTAVSLSPSALASRLRAHSR